MSDKRVRKFQREKGTVICPRCSREETELAGETMYAYHKPPVCEKVTKKPDSPNCPIR